MSRPKIIDEILVAIPKVQKKKSTPSLRYNILLEFTTEGRHPISLDVAQDSFSPDKSIVFFVFGLKIDQSTKLIMTVINKGFFGKSQVGSITLSGADLIQDTAGKIQFELTASNGQKVARISFKYSTDLVLSFPKSGSSAAVGPPPGPGKNQLPTHGGARINAMLHRTESKEEDGYIVPMNGGFGFTNWSSTLPVIKVGNAKGGRASLPRPVTVADLQATVKNVLELRACGTKVRVRAIGHAHTWSPMFVDDSDHVVLSSDMALDQSGATVRFEGLDKSGVPLVRVAGGVTTGEFAQWVDENAELVKYVGMPSNVVLDKVRMAGVIAMGCHGTAWNYGSVPDFVQEVRLVDAQATDRTIKRGEPGFEAAVCHLGLLGIIHSIVFRLAPELRTPTVRMKTISPLLGEMFPRGGTGVSDAFVKMVKSSYSVEVFWYPLNEYNLAKGVQRWDPLKDELWIRVATLEEKVQGRGKFPESVNMFPKLTDLEAKLGFVAGEVVSKVGQPWVQNAFANFLQNREGDGEEAVSMAAAVHWQGGIDNVYIHNFEMCYKVDENFTTVGRAWAAVVGVVTTWVRTKSTIPFFTIECRFTAHSTAILCPNYGSPGDHFMFIEILGFVGALDWYEFQMAVFDAWKDIIGPDGFRSRTHWAKMDGEKPGKLGRLGEYTKEVYGEQIAKFKAEALKVFPKWEVFGNSFLDNVGLVA